MEQPLPSICLKGNGKIRNIYSRALQSPLSGVSDQVFRSLVRRWAPEALLFTEMVNAKSLELGFGRGKVEELSKEVGPIGVQLFNNCPHAIVSAAIRAEAAGAFLIDINMGCPVKKISRKGGGSALLKTPELAAKIVKNVANAVQLPVTVKTRLGWSTESSNPIDFAKRIEDAGAQLITLHGRTRQQGFSGKADWEAIAKVKKAVTIPVIANGDINSVDDALNCLATTGADGVMIGRGSMGAPWLVGQISCALEGKKVFPTPTPKERVGLAVEQLKSLISIKGDHGLLIARKHLNWTCKGFKGASNLRYALMRAKTPDEAFYLLEKQLSSFK